MDLQEALRECLILLDIAADLDAATGGYSKILPSAKAVTRDGILNLDEEQMKDVLRQIEEGGVLSAMPPVQARKIDADVVGEQ
jgi:proteasome beta subunit